jgi:hypothetical protein
MGTDKQVDYLLWAVAEAHRLRQEQEEQRSVASLPRFDPNLCDEAFVTEWQPADEDRPLTHSAH